MNRALLSLRALLVAATCFAGFFSISTAHATALSDLASSMQPGSFAELTGMNGWNSGGILNPMDVSGCTTGDYITQYAEKAPWDPVNKRMVFVGQTHGSCYAGRFVIYTDSSSGWTQGPWLPGVCQSGTPTNPCFSHAYGHNTVDPATGDFYFRQAFTTKFFRYRNGAWASIPSPPTQSSQCCGALEYFPDMKRLIFLDGDWGLWAYDPSANSWKQLANSSVANATAGLVNLAMPSTTVFSIYNPVQKIVLLGGGSNLYKLNASGTVTTLNAPPVSLGATAAVVSVDPVSGKHIVLAGSSIYQYDVAADSWAKLAIALPSTLTALGGVGDGLVETPVSTYGVIMYTKYNNSGSKVYLYKHSPSAPQAPKPNPPTSVTAQ